MCDVAVFTEARLGDPKTPALSTSEVERNLDMLLTIAGKLGYARKPGDKVLDLGCGIGDTVAALVARGFDAYGVDVGEWWGRDHDAYWHDSPIPPDHIRHRLSATSEAAYRLPYPDGHFDLVVSSQVFEHVFNYVDVFRELKRVTKPGGVSVHVFPGRGAPFEPHMRVPINALSKHDWWLRLWALVSRKHRSTWRGEFEYLREHMRYNNYPSRSKLCAFAREAGARLSFHEALYVEASKGRPWKLMQSRIGWLLRPLLLRLCQRCMRLL
jgi:ubiquinone/menaquinone biosynthesis C-methylase UbiE